MCGLFVIDEPFDLLCCVTQEPRLHSSWNVNDEATMVWIWSDGCSL